MAKKIVIIGGFGSKDIGDEAMPKNDIINLRKRINNLDIVMLTSDVEYTKKYHRESAVPNIGVGLKGSPIKLVATALLCIIESIFHRLGFHFRLSGKKGDAFYHISTADLIFNVGGGNLNTVTGIEVYRKMLIYLIADIMKIPVIISGQTIGPFETKITPLILRWVLNLNSVKMITLRDKKHSLNQLKEMNVSKPIIKSTADDAISLPILSEEDSYHILLNEVGQSWINEKTDLIIALNMKGSMKRYKGKKRSKDISKEIELLERLAKALIEKFNAKIIFIPTSYEEDGDDREIHNQIISKIKNKKRIASINSELSDIALKSLMRYVDIAIGARYHFSVFALSMNVPAIGIASGEYQRTKLKGILNLYEIQELIIDEDMEYLELETLLDRMEYTIENKAGILEKLRVANPKLEREYLISIEYATKLLSGINKKGGRNVYFHR